MDELIASIEAVFPDLRWLVRRCEPDARHVGSPYYAHICNTDYSQSYEGKADTGIEALQQAFDRAKAANAA